jgi:hypothetical protein
MPRNGTKNLIPMNMRTKEQQKEIARKGGIASQKKQKQNKTFKEMLRIIGDLQVQDPKLTKQLEELGIPKEDITYSFLVNYAQFQKAIKERDTRSAEYIRDTLGETPIIEQKIEVENVVEDLTPLATLLGVNMNDLGNINNNESN